MARRECRWPSWACSFSIDGASTRRGPTRRSRSSCGSRCTTPACTARSPGSSSRRSCRPSRRPAPAPLLAQAATALAALEHAEREMKERERRHDGKARAAAGGTVWDWASRNLSAASERLLSPADRIERILAPWSAYVDPAAVRVLGHGREARRSTSRATSRSASCWGRPRSRGRQAARDLPWRRGRR